MDSPDMTPEVRQAVTKWIVQAALGAIGYAAVIFLSAGTLQWVWGWVMVAVITLVLIAHPLLLIPSNPELLAERQKGTLAEGVKGYALPVGLGVGLAAGHGRGPAFSGPHGVGRSHPAGGTARLRRLCRAYPLSAGAPLVVK